MIKHPISDELHEAIKHLYQNKKPWSGEVAAFAKKKGIPKWKVSDYACRMGWSPVSYSTPRWDDTEVAILEGNVRLHPKTIQRKLQKAGYIRSVSSIMAKRKKLRLLQNLNGQTATDLALCLGVHQSWVLREIKEGRLVAGRRDAGRTNTVAGDPYYITDKRIREWLVEWIDRVDIRRVDKYWLVDVLTGRGDRG